jgi:hypothetical protein
VKPGRHAAGDGSFGRSAGTQTLRGAALLGVALVIGIVLLRTAPSESTTTVHSPSTTRTTARPAISGLTTPAPTTTAAPRSPSQVSVLVANGTNVNGAAGRIKSQLLQDGYNTVGTSNATTSSATTTAVYFVPGYQAEAALLAGALGLQPSAAQAMPSPSPVTDTKGANIVVVVGSDLASQISSSSGPPATTSPPATTAHTTTTVHHTTTTVHTATTVHTTTTA